jgi:hypothetical protein
VMLPLMLRGTDPSLRAAPARRTAAGFVIALGASVALFLPSGGLRELYDHTLGFQLGRPDVFSPWALHPGLAPVKVLVEIAVAGLALVLVLRPVGPRSVAQVSALAGALTIAVQLLAVHWFYFYIVWFVPFVLIAVVSEVRASPAPEDEVEPPDRRECPTPAPAPVLAGQKGVVAGVGAG